MTDWQLLINFLKCTIGWHDWELMQQCTNSKAAPEEHYQLWQCKRCYKQKTTWTWE